MKRWLWLVAAIGGGIWGFAGFAPAQALFSDTFTGSDFKRPVNWQVFEAPDLDPASEDKYWYLTGGTFSTGNGDYTGLQTSGWSFAIVNTPEASGWTDYTVRVDFRMTQRNGAVGVVGRWQDVQNHYRGFVRANEGFYSIGIERVRNGQVAELKLLRSADGVALPKFDQSLSPLDRHTLAMTLTGDQISVALDGQTYITITDSTFSGGAAGLAEQWNLVYFDNFAVEPPGAAAATPAAGGLWAAAGPGGGSVYRIVVGRGLTAQDAEKLKADLEGFGYPVVDIVAKGNLNDVLVGALSSEMDAKSSAAMLQEDGFQVVAIEQLVGEQASELARRSVEEPAAADQVFRVLIQEYPDEASAQDLKNSLDADGYFPELIQVQGRYGVYLGRFSDMNEAQKLVDALQTDGYVSAHAVSMTEATAGFPAPGAVAAVSPLAIPSTDLRQEIEQAARQAGTTLTPEQIAQLESIITGARTTNMQLADQIAQIRAEIKNLQQEQKTVLQSVRERIEERERKQAQVAQLYNEADMARDAQNFDLADQKLQQILEIDPTQRGSVEFKRRLLVSLRNNTTLGGEAMLEEIRKQIEAATREAQAAEQQGDLAMALTYWTQIVNIARDGSFDKNHARQRVSEIRTKMLEKEKQAARKNQMLYYIIGAVGVLVLILLIGLLLVWRSKRSLDQQLLERVQELTVQPYIDPRTGLATPGAPGTETMAPAGMMELGKAQVDESQAPPQPAPSPAPQAARPPARPAPAAAAPAASSPAPPPPAVQQPAPAPKAGEDDIFAMPSFDEGEERQKLRQRRREQEQQAAAGRQAAEEEVALESFSFEETPLPSGPPAGAPAPAPAAVEPSSSAGSDEPMTLDLSGINLSDLEFAVEGVSEAAPSAPDVFDEPTIKAPEAAPPPPRKESPEPAVSAGVTGSPLDSLDLEFEDTKAVSQPPAAPPQPPAAQPPAPPTPPPAPKAAPAKAPAPAAPARPAAASAAPTASDADKTVVLKPAAAAAEMEATHRLKPDVMAPTVKLKKTEEAQPPEAKKPAAAAGVETSPDATAGQTIYVQRFDDEEEGQPPRNWTGSYDYASLLVTSEHTANGMGRCMKFEKKTGAGSAYYSCQFPNASGRVVVEFDICCDNKNKYLLGFYVEKDKDFRKSIHTIVHRTATATHPTLRIQGEPVEYNLGEWRHVKYVLDLEKGFVDGFVDGQLVADHVKLENVPEYVNTLAIRDNLPTTGVLRVGNIVISKLS
ncbi:MAG: hypothetical protein Kow0059_13910 [Candidatus Sumerlaeia bacterium]